MLDRAQSHTFEEFVLNTQTNSVNQAQTVQ